MPKNVNIDEISEKFDSISGSDISNAVLNSAFKAARRKMDIVDKELFYESVKDILASKEANKMGEVIVTERKVPEQYVKQQMKKAKRYKKGV